MKLCAQKNRFQSTPLREGRHITYKLHDETVIFQSTPLREGRLYLENGAIVRYDFNPRPSVRGDSVNVFRRLICNYFNPRPSVRGDVSRMTMFSR